MIDEQTIVKICGTYPDNFEPIQIKPGEIVVFTNDPNYEAVKVFDQDRNSVFVNSFVECEHYVTGGWSLIPEVDFIPGQDLENTLQTSFVLLSIISIVLGFLYIKRYIKRFS
tara:strand:+ start:48622 stop:48957 length:336 start_codon:yes stop_codon:yes gene_type:complete